MLSRLKIAPRITLLILLGTGIILAAVTASDYRSARRLLEAEILERANYLALSVAREMRVIQGAVEKVVLEITVALQAKPFNSEEVFRLLEGSVEAHEELFGSAVVHGADGPEGSRTRALPYVYRGPEGLERKDLATGGYPYETFDWYLIPKETGAPAWTEPYYDEGGGNRLMVTYSVPIFVGEERRFVGVATGDLTLLWLTSLMDSMALPDDGYAFLVSRSGTVIAHPNRELIMNESIFSLAEEHGRPEARDLGRRMVRQEKGSVEYFGFLGSELSWLTYTPVPETGWSLGVIFPQRKITEDLISLSRMKVTIGVIGALAMVAVALAIAHSISRPIRALDTAARALARGDLDAALPEPRGRDEVARLTNSFAQMRFDLKRYVKELQETTEAKARIDADLETARAIQRGMVPRRFRFDPPRPEIDIHAILEPARMVGGDFYDFFLTGERLFIAVGDVSGKGVPAAIFMAVAKAYLKAFAYRTPDPGLALALLNDELAAENEEAMYLTVFCASIDLETGECRCANGGHVAPSIVRSGGTVEELAVGKGGLIGLTPGARFETVRSKLGRGDLLVVVSDGVIEAEDRSQRLYGEERMRRVLSQLAGTSARTAIDRLREDVGRFAGDAVQSDDITLLAVRLVDPNAPGASAPGAGPS